ncbi:hypothetical protein [Jeotgalibacillus marinus]|uniref:Uncharacterized protein n=1 Tax=Jeotgalibacillus marinus TaxID=86667 RepID=A0ABV3Q7H6_9BACL
MNKKMISGVLAVGILSLGGLSYGNVFAAENNNAVDQEQDKEMMKGNKAERMERAQELANQFGVDISALNQEDAKEAILEAMKAAKDGIETNKGELMNEKQADRMVKAQELAEEFGVDISGLDQEDAKEAILEAMKAAKDGIETNKGELMNEKQADRMVKAQELAEEFGVDISGLDQEDAKETILEAMEATKDEM